MYRTFIENEFPLQHTRNSYLPTYVRLSIMHDYISLSLSLNLFLPSSSSCLNNGTCVDDINTFSCRCRPGFYGTFCEYEQNECDSQPCKNGGTCTDGLGSYRCTCPVGYNGQNCQVECVCSMVLAWFFI